MRYSLEASRQVETIGLRTVYRIVRKLEDDQNEITAVTLPSHPDRYELTPKSPNTHHHHFHCAPTATDSTTCRWVPGAAQEVCCRTASCCTEHELTLKGLCSCLRLTLDLNPP